MTLIDTNVPSPTDQHAPDGKLLPRPHLVAPVSTHKFLRAVRTIFQCPAIFRQLRRTPACDPGFRTFLGVKAVRHLGVRGREPNSDQHGRAAGKLSHRSTSPNTMSSEPRIAETSASM